MEWVKHATNYYLDAAMIRAGEAAEVLYLRAKAWCGDQENGGHVPREILPRLTPQRGVARARALVREGLWSVVDGGWQFADWDQVTPEQIAARREGGRSRQAAWRARRSGVSNAVTNATVTGEKREEGEETAAAAAATLPGPLDVLRSKLQAHTPLRALRFDSLTPDVLDRLDRLLEVHGDEPLVRVAVDTCRNPPPVHVGAFLGTWEALPAPGARRLGVVRQQLCPTHSTTLNAAGVCSACASDQIASDR